MPLLPLRDAPEQWATRRYSVTIDFFFPQQLSTAKGDRRFDVDRNGPSRVGR